MTMCESDRGEWGKVCPDCGQRLPAKQPRLTSWKSERDIDPAMRSRAATGISIRPELRRRGQMWLAARQLDA